MHQLQEAHGDEERGGGQERANPEGKGALRQQSRPVQVELLQENEDGQPETQIRDKQRTCRSTQRTHRIVCEWCAQIEKDRSKKIE